MESRVRGATWVRPAGAGASLATHVAVLAFLLWPRPTPPDAPVVEPIPIALAQPAPVEPSPVPKPLAETPTPPAPPRSPPAPTKAPPKAQAVAPAAASDDAQDEEPTPVAALGEADLVGAATADSGSGDGCGMVRRLQTALRRDPLVRSATTGVVPRGKALLVWNGDWVRSVGEDGKGLAAVREALAWEVGFAPAACRVQAVHGLVLVSLGDGPEATRLAFGTSAWRWSDLLR